MTNPKTTVDFAAYGLCAECAEHLADAMKTILMTVEEPHLFGTVIYMSTNNSQDMAIATHNESTQKKLLNELYSHVGKALS